MARNFNQGEDFKKEFNPKHFKRLLTYLLPYKKMVIGTLFIILAISMAELAGPILMQQAIDNAIPDKDLSALNMIGFAYLGLRLVMLIGSYLREILLNKVGQSIIYDIRKQLFDHIQRLSLRFFDGRPAGKVMVRITNDVDNLNQLLTSGLIQVINDIVTLIMIMGVMIYMSWRLALFSFVILPVLFYIALVLRNYVRESWRDVRRKRATMNAFLQESISGMRTIQAFTQEDESEDEFHDINENFTEAQIKATKMSLFFRPSVELTSAIGNCIVFAYGAYSVVNGEISVGVLVAFINYIGRFWKPIRRMSNFYNQVLVAMASSERVFGILDTKPEIKNKDNAKLAKDMEGKVDFNNVYFEYDKNVPVLKNIDFHINPGETIAIVGPTGAGKSTIINLIPRFYDVIDGSINIDDVNVKDIEMDSLREQMSIVLQDPLIFSGTIKENIKYAKLDATDEEIIEAAKIANAHHFITEFENGYETEVQERGSRLSVGQRQLISFARAVLSDPKILILDEATSSIDTNTERLIQEAIERVLEGRTSFVIAHRLSTIRKADKIFLIDQGEIIEEGTHEELMNKKGVYYELNKVQYKSLLDAMGD
ncbi:MAG: ABC transporter ATP-binding protein [Clostridia bacterium]